MLFNGEKMKKEKPKSCLNCKHSFNKEICTLREDLIEKIGSCFMWSQR